MYIRVKRKKATVFLHVEPTDTVLEVKQKLQELLEQVRAAADRAAPAPLRPLLTRLAARRAAAREAAAAQGGGRPGGCQEAVGPQGGERGHAGADLPARRWAAAPRSRPRSFIAVRAAITTGAAAPPAAAAAPLQTARGRPSTSHPTTRAHQPAQTAEQGRGAGLAAT